MLSPYQKQAYRRRVLAMSEDELADEIERCSFLAARITAYSEYDQKCSILATTNPPLYDAVRARLSRSLRAR